ncbi:hypothetical protein D9611_004357 [Ephemerocybe angulata]|uniref:NYN domain-containing protein n=1 Tax=Ephemerocybe angulata TaxID=980116 RepID=A0A8H5F5X7_9AGAR|nr:hypothetical protein D9611_004357 [Tulosesus angulatus]
MGHSLKETAVFWDFGSCPAGAESSGFTLVDRIRSFALQFGAIKTFKAYLTVTDHNAAVANGRALPLRSEMQSSGVSLTDVPGRKDVADRMLIVDMLAYAFERPPSTTTLILITAETAFAYCLSVLRMREYRVALLTPEQMSTSSLIAQVPICFDWAPDVVDEEDLPPQPQRPKKPTQTYSTPQPRGDATKEPTAVPRAVDLVGPTNSTSKQPLLNPTDTHLSAASTFPVSYSATREEEVDIEDYLPRQQDTATSAAEDLFHVLPTVAERHTREAGNALSTAIPTTPEELPKQKTQFDSIGSVDRSSLDSDSPPSSSPSSESDHHDHVKRLQEISAYHYTSSEASCTTDLGDGRQNESTRASSCPPDALPIKQEHDLDSPPVYSHSPPQHVHSPGRLSQPAERWSPELEIEDSLAAAGEASLSLQPVVLIDSDNREYPLSHDSVPNAFLPSMPYPPPNTPTLPPQPEGDDRCHRSPSPAHEDLEVPSFSQRPPTFEPQAPPSPTPPLLLADTSSQSSTLSTANAAQDMCAECLPSDLGLEAPGATTSISGPSVRPAIAPHFEVLVEVMEEFQKLNREASVNRAELGVRLPRRDPDVYSQTGPTIIDGVAPLVKYIDAAIEANILVNDSKFYVSLHPHMLLPKSPITSIPSPSTPKAVAGPSPRPVVAPHFEILVSVMEFYLKIGQASVKISQLGAQLPKRKPDVYTQAGCGTLLMYLEAAIGAGVIVKDSTECFSLHPNMLSSKSSEQTTTPPTPHIPSSTKSNGLVAPTFDAILAVMHYYAKYYGQPSVFLSSLAEQLLNRRPFDFSPPGTSDAIRLYIEAAVGADILVRDSAFTVVLHPRLLQKSKGSVPRDPPPAPPLSSPPPVPAPGPSVLPPALPSSTPTPSISSHEAALLQFNVVIAVMEDYRRKGETSVNRAKLGVDLPKRKADVYATAGYGSSSKPLRNYIDAAIAAGVLIRDSDELVSLPLSTPQPTVAPQYEVLVQYMKKARAAGRTTVWRSDLGMQLPQRQPDVYAQAGLSANSKPFKMYADTAIQSGILVRDNADYVSLHPTYW